MISKEELKMMNVFRGALFREFSVKDIMNEMEKNSYNWVFNSVKKLLNLNLIIFSKKAGVKMYSINWNNPLLFRYFSIIDYEDISKLPMKNIFELINSSPVKYFSLIVGGSYVKNKNKKGSDLDLVVIVENKVDVKRVQNVLDNKAILMIPKVDLYVFSRDNFLEMLLDREENLGKQFFENGLILFGSESYYQIVREAEKNGFRG